jgi:hypothetical protein
VAAIWYMIEAFSNAIDVCVVNLEVNASLHGKETRISGKRSSRSSSWPKYFVNSEAAVQSKIDPIRASDTFTGILLTSQVTSSTSYSVLTTSLQRCTFSGVCIWVLAVG